MQQKFNIVILVFLLSLLLPFRGIGDIPIQESGRIKPLDTFARNKLLSFYGKSKLLNSSLLSYLLLLGNTFQNLKVSSPAPVTIEFPSY